MALLKRSIIFITSVVNIGCLPSGLLSYYSTDSSDYENTIYVVFHGWHTGIIIKAEDVGCELDFLSSYLNDNYYEFGWGDADFYQANEITSGILLKAVFLPSSSVMHVVGLTRNPDSIYPKNRIFKFKVSSGGLKKLTGFISGSFKTDGQGQPVKLNQNLYGKSMFFEGTGIYHIANTCNTWASEALNTAGLPIRTCLTLTSGNLLGQIEKLNISSGTSP